MKKDRKEAPDPLRELRKHLDGLERQDRDRGLFMGGVMKSFTRTELLKYLDKLDPEVKELCVCIDRLVLCAADTGSESFQVLAAMDEVVWDRAKVYMEYWGDG